MKFKFILFFGLLAFFLTGCNLIKQLTGETAPQAEPKGFGAAREQDLDLKVSSTDVTLEWGVPTDVPLDIKWLAGQKYPVQINAAASTPQWLVVETKPGILEPPGTMSLKITAKAGEAELGEKSLVLEASAYGMNEPKRFTLNLDIRRQSGKFAPVLSAPVTLECRNICGKYKDGKVTFYDLLREKDQSCGEFSKLPDNQKIGGKSWSVGSNGFGYGRTCDVAAVFGNDGGLQLINLGLPGASVARGEVLLTVRPAQACWFSQDNTIALISTGTQITPYDARTGQVLGSSCSFYGTLSEASLDGNQIVAQSSRRCDWDIR